MSDVYNPKEMGGEAEEKMLRKFNIQLDDAKNYFENVTKPRLDRAYKLYIAYVGDRAKEIKKWQSNIFVPYVQAVVETLMPRILDARPEFSVQGRNQDDQETASRVANLGDWNWEIAGMDATSENVVRASLVFGTGFIQTSWKKDVRTHKFLQTKDLAKKRYAWKEKEQVFYDAPYAEWVDNYSLWYDWHNIPRESKQYWFKRLILTGEEIRRRYPMADEKRLTLALKAQGGDLTDYATVRNQVKLTHDKINRGSDWLLSNSGTSSDRYKYASDPDLSMHEVFEWWRPFEDAYAVMVNKVPILKGAFIPNPYDHKEAPFIDIPFLKLMGEYEGMGLPLILESPQIMLNMIKNQRLDAATLNIHKMWIVNPLANIDKKELVTRPFGIIYSVDPNGVKEVQFSDIKSSAYQEEELLKGDMRYASGVDDFSMGVGGNSSSATEVRHLRESTLERVRLFINHLGDGYSKVLRHWISMWRQFMTDAVMLRVVGDEGKQSFPLIAKDDITGEYDFKAMVIPSIAGKNDIDRKQNMDLFQLLINLPFVDPRKLTSKVLQPWNWSLDSVTKTEEPAPGMPGMPGAPAPGAQPGAQPGMDQLAALMGGPNPTSQPGGYQPESNPAPQLNGSGEIPQSIIDQAMQLLGSDQEQPGFGQAANPIDLLQSGGLPPTVKGVPMPTTNPRGLNMTGKVNTNIPLNQNYSAESNNLGQAQNIQR